MAAAQCIPMERIEVPQYLVHGILEFELDPYVSEQKQMYLYGRFFKVKHKLEKMPFYQQEKTVNY